MNTNGINKSMAILGFGALDDAISAPAFVRQEFRSFCFIEALPYAGEVLGNFDVIVGVINTENTAASPSMIGRMKTPSTYFTARCQNVPS